MKNLIRKNVLLTGVFAVILSISSSAPAQTNEEFIQGKWRVTGQLPPNQSGNSMQWFLEWTFTDGKFVEEGYPPLSQKGKFRVLKDEDSRLMLEFYDQNGTFGTKNSKLEIVLDKGGNSLKIGQNAGFKRVPKSKE